MNIIKLYTGDDQLSYFCEIDIELPTILELGQYSMPYPVTSLLFREFEAGRFFDWHNAPRSQYIIYLEGEVEVEASGGEKRTFKSGDILYATDLAGKGHMSKTLTKGRSLVLATD